MKVKTGLVLISGLLFALSYISEARLSENDPFYIPPSPTSSVDPHRMTGNLEESPTSTDITPNDPIDETIIGALNPSTQEELDNYRDEVGNYMEKYRGKDFSELQEDRDYWTGQLDWWCKHPFIDGFINGPERVEEAKLRLIALNSVLAEKYAEQNGLSEAQKEQFRQQLDEATLKDSNGEYKQLKKTPEEAIEEKVSHYVYDEAVKWYRYWQSQYNYWVTKAKEEGVVLNDGIFNAGDQIDAAVLYIKALGERINQIREQYGYSPVEIPQLQNTEELGLSTEPYTAGTKHTPKRPLQEDLIYWYHQLHTNLGSLEQTQVRRDYARGVLYTEISYLLQNYDRNLVIQYLMNIFRISQEEVEDLLQKIQNNTEESEE